MLFGPKSTAYRERLLLPKDRNRLISTGRLTPGAARASRIASTMRGASRVSRSTLPR